MISLFTQPVRGQQTDLSCPQERVLREPRSGLGDPRATSDKSPSSPLSGQKDGGLTPSRLQTHTACQRSARLGRWDRQCKDWSSKSSLIFPTPPVARPKLASHRVGNLLFIRATHARVGKLEVNCGGSACRSSRSWVSFGTRGQRSGRPEVVHSGRTEPLNINPLSKASGLLMCHKTK